MGCASTIPHSHDSHSKDDSAKSNAQGKKGDNIRRSENNKTLPPLDPQSAKNAILTMTTNIANSSLSDYRNKSQSAGTIISMSGNTNTILISLPQLEQPLALCSPTSQRYKVQTGGLIDEDELLNSSRRSVRFGDSPGNGPSSPAVLFTSAPSGARNNSKTNSITPQTPNSTRRRSSQQPSARPQFPHLQDANGEDVEETSSEYFEGFLSGDADNELAPYDLESENGNVKTNASRAANREPNGEESEGYLSAMDKLQVKRINSQRRKQCTLSSDPQTLDHYRKGTFNIPDDDAYFDASRVVVVGSAKSSLADFNSIASDNVMSGSIRSSSASTMSNGGGGIIKSALRQVRQPAVVAMKRSIHKPKTKTINGGEGLFDYMAFGDGIESNGGLLVPDYDADASTFDALAIPIVARSSTCNISTNVPPPSPIAEGNKDLSKASTQENKFSTLPTTSAKKENAPPTLANKDELLSSRTQSNDFVEGRESSVDKRVVQNDFSVNEEKENKKDGEELSASISSPTAQRLLRIQTTFLESNQLGKSTSPRNVTDTFTPTDVNPARQSEDRGNRRGNHFSSLPQDHPPFKALGGTSSSTFPGTQHEPHVHRFSLTSSNGSHNHPVAILRAVRHNSNLNNSTTNNISGMFGESSMRSNSLVSAADLAPMQFVEEGGGGGSESKGNAANHQSIVSTRTIVDGEAGSTKGSRRQSQSMNRTPNQQTDIPTLEGKDRKHDDTGSSGIVSPRTQGAAIPTSLTTKSPTTREAPQFGVPHKNTESSCAHTPSGGYLPPLIKSPSLPVVLSPTAK